MGKWECHSGTLDSTSAPLEGRGIAWIVHGECGGLASVYVEGEVADDVVFRTVANTFTDGKVCVHANRSDGQ